MTVSEAVKLKIMTFHGWHVNRIFPVDNPGGYWMADNGKNQVIEFSAHDLFESWCNEPEVMEQVLNVNIIRKGTPNEGKKN